MVYSAENQPVLNLAFPGIRCPSSVRDPANASSYVGLHHPEEKSIDSKDFGTFVLNDAISVDDVGDGLANTAFISEKLITAFDLGWLSGTRSTLRNVGQGIVSQVDTFSEPSVQVVGSIGSRHPAGVHILMAPGQFDSNPIKRINAFCVRWLIAEMASYPLECNLRSATRAEYPVIAIYYLESCNLLIRIR